MTRRAPSNAAVRSASSFEDNQPRGGARITTAITALSLLAAIGSLIVAHAALRSQRVVSAWQIVTSKDCGNSGKVSALEVLRRRNETISRIDFSWANECDKELFVHLRGLNMRGQNLREIRMIRVDLSEADLRNADLRRAKMSDVRLNGARMNGAELDHAELNAASVREAILLDASLNNVELKRSKMQKADMRGATLEGADLRYADLREVDLTGANLKGSDLRKANLAGANLSGASFDSAVLEGEELEGAWAWNHNPPTGLSKGVDDLVIRCRQSLEDYYYRHYVPRFLREPMTCKRR